MSCNFCKSLKVNWVNFKLLQGVVLNGGCATTLALPIVMHALLIAFSKLERTFSFTYFAR